MDRCMILPDHKGCKIIVSDEMISVNDLNLIIIWIFITQFIKNALGSMDVNGHYTFVNDKSDWC